MGSEPDSSDTESEANDDGQEIIAVAPVHWDVSQAFDHYDISPDNEISPLQEAFSGFSPYVDDDFNMHLPQEQPMAPVPGSLVVPVEESKGVGSLIIQISESDTRQ